MTIYRYRITLDFNTSQHDLFFATPEGVTKYLRTTTYSYPKILLYWDGKHEVKEKVGLGTITLTPIEVKE